jgi:hypothetical protein
MKGGLIATATTGKRNNAQNARSIDIIRRKEGVAGDPLMKIRPSPFMKTLANYRNRNKG